jgi:hypothetical protein
LALLSTTTLRTDYLPGVASGDSDNIAILGRALARVEILIARYLGYPGASPTWESSSYTLRVAGTTQQPRILALGLAPITAIASIYQDLNLVFDSSTLVASSDYEQENLANGARLYLLPLGTTPSWYTQVRSIKVTCTAGYANEAAVPKPLADACYRWVADWWLRRTNRHLGSIAQGQVNQGLRELEAIPGDIEALLASWRLLGTVGVT